MQFLSSATRKDLAMFGKLKKNGCYSAKLRFAVKHELPWKHQPFIIRWYPSNRSCLNMGRRKPRPGQMPPLMVRKPEWRR